MSSRKTHKKDLLFKTGSYIRNNSFLFSLSRWRKSFKGHLVHSDTDLCIDGFQRCGNTYFKEMFLESNPEANLAHHIHGAAQVRRAIELQIPTAVLIRRPIDALASLITYDEALSYKVAIQAYCNYYIALMSLTDKFLIIEFDDLIEDYNLQIARINERFDVSLAPSKLSTEGARNMMKARQDKYSSTKSMPFPNEYKKERNKFHKSAIENLTDLNQAIDVYNTFRARQAS